MVDDFSAAVAGWQSFYNLAGSAAFTLLGLVFVAVSINIGIMGRADEKGDLRQFARETLGSFLAIMIISLVFMIPAQGPRGIGIPLLVVGLLMLMRVAKLWKRFYFERKGELFMDRSLFQKRLLIPNSVCYLALILISIELLYGNADYLDWMTMVILWILLAGSINAWFLMLRLAELAQENGTTR
jgi:hypothetical protein